jgi:hypothetical protein
VNEKPAPSKNEGCGTRHTLGCLVMVGCHPPFAKLGEGRGTLKT